MIKKILRIKFAFLVLSTANAQVGIGTTTPESSAILEVKSTEKGFLPPRLTTAERDAIVSPAVGLVVYNTTTNCLNFYVGTGWNETCGTASLPLGVISALNCASANNNGTLIEGELASGVSIEVPYTGGNGGTYTGQTVSSTGVNGLTASLAAGTFVNGTGTLTYNITGTPNEAGTANFAINIGGQTCNLMFNVAVAVDFADQYPEGTIFCNSTATQVIEVTNPITGKTWMDRNLGASRVAIASNDTQAFGDLYQWGRKGLGHQCRNSSFANNLLSNTDIPPNDYFIIPTHHPFDWRNPQNDNLWQGVNGVNNPCPNGYRLPTDAELNNERLSWNIMNAAGAFASPLKWTVAGYRASGSTISNVGSGFYWSSSVSGTRSRILYFGNSDAFMESDNRATGNSVRCIKD